MALTELQDWIMRELAGRNGLIEGMPARAGVSVDDMEQAVDGLSKRKFVSVAGPPNQNSYLGMDVDELRLSPYGISYLRALRR